MKGIIFIILLFPNILLFGQSKKIEGHTKKIEGHRYWLGFGMNMGVASKESKSLCGSFNVGVNYAEGKSKYEFRYSKLDVDIFRRNYDRYNKYSLFYGRGIVRKEFYLMVSGGISLNHDVTYYKIRDDIFIWSFPMELELFWKAEKYGGFGISFSVDYSPKMSIISIGSSFGLGKMK